MSKKDIDFGLKDIKIDDYKLKKNNSGKLIFIIILIAVTISYFQYSSKKSVDQIDSSNLKSLNKEQLQFFRRENFGYIYQDSLKRLNPLMTVGEHLSELFKIHQPNQSNSLIRE